MNLLVHQAALGDWVLTWPLLRALAPGHTCVAASWSRANLAERMFGHVEAVHIEHPDFTSLHAEGGFKRITPRQCERLAGVTAVFSFVSGGEDAWAANIRRLVAGDARCHFIRPRPPRDWPRHVCDWQADQLRRQGYDGPVCVAPPVRTNATGPIVIHPGSGGADKCWAADRFETVIDALQRDGREVRVVLGEVEAETWPPRRLDAWRGRFGAEAVESLDELADALAAARLYIGNDSGPTHLAAQLGVTTLALFGPSDRVQWSPLGPRVTVLAPPAPESMKWLTTQRVLDAAGVLLDDR